MHGYLSSEPELDFLRSRLARVEAELRFKTEALESSLNGFDVLSAEGRFLHANQAYLDMWGYPCLEDLLASEPADHCCDTDTFATILSSLEESGQCVVRFEARRRDGSTFDALMYCRLTHNEDNQKVYTRTSIDVSQHTSADQRHHEAERLEALGRLASGVAHDFNNLLTVINGNADLFLADHAHRSEGADFIIQIAQAGRQAAALTSQLLAFSKQSPAEPTCQDVNDTVLKMRGMFERVIGENIQISLELEESPCTIMIGASQIEQVLMNLVINARDAMPNGGKLTMKTSQVEVCEAPEDALPCGRYVQLQVTDSGHGLDPKLQTRIFEPFFTTKKSLGTGLGLATVYGIVQQAGGAIRVRSLPGEGTTFSVHLPYKNCCPAPPRDSRAVMPRTSLQETILLVEDDRAVRQIASRILQKLGYMVIEAANGDEALEAVVNHEGPIDLLLTDVVMPGLGGVPLAQQLLSTQPNLKVLFVSGYNSEQLAKTGLPAGHFKLLSKPYTLRELSLGVRSVLESRPSANGIPS